MKRKFYNPGVYAITANDRTVKYIGVAKSWEERGYSHWKKFISLGHVVNHRLQMWFESLRAEGKTPILELIESCQNFEIAKEQERFWIKTYRAYEEAMCNITEGGNHIPDDLASTGGRLGGLIGGKIGGPIGARHPNAKAALAKARTIEHQRKAGSLGGSITQKLYPEKRKEWGRLGAKNQSHEDKVKASKLGAEVRGKQLSSPEGRNHQSQAGLKGVHSYWHVRRDRPNPSCQFCRPNFIDLWESPHA